MLARFSLREHPRMIVLVLVVVAGLLVSLSLQPYATVPENVIENDWSRSFVPAALNWLHGADPYTTPLPFASPPWTLFILAPLAWIPANIAMLLPAVALLYCAWRVRKPWLMAVVGLSFPFLAAVAYANIDWIVMVGLVVGGRVGFILNTVKPQAGIFANVALLSRQKTWRDRLLLMLPLGVLALLTLPLMGAWVEGMRSIGYDIGTVRNFSLFPYSVPLGIVGLYFAWRRQSIIWGVIASLSLSPYFYVHSFLPLLFVVAQRDWRWGVALNLLIWAVIGLIVLEIIPISL